MITFAKISAEKKLILLTQLKNKDDYLAHIKGNDKETLSEHSNLVMQYFNKLVEENNLENLIDNLIEKDVVKVFSKTNLKIQNLIKVMFIGTIYFHDFGKINQNFQREKMCNLSFTEATNGIGSEHSILSAYLYLAYFNKQISELNLPEDENYYLALITLSFSHSIVKHHGELADGIKLVLNEKLVAQLSNYFELFGVKYFVEKELVKELLDNVDDLKNYKSDFTDDAAVYILLKLNSSLLTASDYLATNEFMIGSKVEDYGILSDELKSKIIRGIENISYNKTLYSNLYNFHQLNFKDLQDFSNDSINLVRQKLSAEVISNFRQNNKNKLFYIEAPTGSGKTNLSLLLIAELLKIRNDITKIFYVFPFTSLITQNINDFKRDLKLTDREIIQIHSKSTFYNSNSDDFYGSLKQNYIDALFVNFPFILLSHIKFFNSLISNDKEDNYLLHRVANSIVVIDELQSYTPSEWDKLNYLINEFSESLNITFMLMSATLPKISQLMINGRNDNFAYLVENKKEYFNNPNFAKRVIFNFDYLDKSSFTFSNDSFAEIVLKHSEEYYLKENNIHTLIEFITKKSAKSFFEYISKGNYLTDYEFLFIDGTVIEPRRLEIINYLKSPEKRDKIIVVATQVIEAGLNLDMDIGFKDISLLDSDEQFAGRINRNATKFNSIIYLFNSENARYVYGNDLRYIEQNNINRADLNEILKTKEFDKYYSTVFDNIMGFNNDAFAENISSFLNYLKMLKYWDVRNNFKLIDSKTISIFVPLSISQKYFSEIELEFLSQNNLKLDSEEKISGEEIFEYYSSLILIKNTNNDFLKIKTEFKILSAIMSKFVFNSYFNNNFTNLLSHYGEEKYGYFYLSFWDKIYTYDNGLKSDLETDLNFI